MIINRIYETQNLLSLLLLSFLVGLRTYQHFCISNLCRGYGLAATCDTVVSVYVILTQFSIMNSEYLIVFNVKDPRQVS